MLKNIGPLKNLSREEFLAYAALRRKEARGRAKEKKELAAKQREERKNQTAADKHAKLLAERVSEFSPIVQQISQETQARTWTGSSGTIYFHDSDLNEFVHSMLSVIWGIKYNQPTYDESFVDTEGFGQNEDWILPFPDAVANSAITYAQTHELTPAMETLFMKFLETVIPYFDKHPAEQEAKWVEETKQEYARRKLRSAEQPIVSVPEVLANA